MCRILHCQDNVDRLYILRKNGRRKIINNEDCREMETENLKKYVENSSEDQQMIKKLEKLGKKLWRS